MMQENTLLYIPKEKYHGNTTHVSSSRLKKLKISPYHFNSLQETDSSAFAFGRCFEDALVGEVNYSLFDDSENIKEIGGKNPRATNKYKEWKKGFLSRNDKELFKIDDFNLLERSVLIAKQNKVMNAFIKNGLREPSIFFRFNGCRLKSRPDFVVTNGTQAAIIDVKTSQDGSPFGFRKNVRKYDYTQQAIMQILAVEACGYEVTEYYWGVMCKITGLFTIYRFESFQQDKAKEELTELTNKLSDLKACSRMGYDFHSDNELGIMSLEL